jgi:ESS family glutamate:Na+ symporter
VRFWTLDALSAAAISVLSMIALVWIAAELSRRFRAFHWVPRALTAGLLGLVLGPPVADVLPVSRLGLETLVYHGLGLVFAAVALREPASREESGHDARIIATALPGIAALQGLVGVAVVALLLAMGDGVHIGFGLLLPLGFNQGPGQALSMGEAWEPLGLEDGGGIGLIIAALGFAWCCMGGIALIVRGRRRGWLASRGHPTRASSGPRPIAATRLSSALVVLGVTYGLTYATLVAVEPRIPNERGVALLYGFHFMIALSYGVVVRPVAVRLRARPDDGALAWVSGSMVDVTTTAALAAVSVGVLTRWLGPVLALTMLGGLSTLAVCLWLRPRFRHDGMEHALLVYGIATGTFLTGMALLRAVDPEFRSPAARNAVVAAGAEVIFAAPLLLIVMPYAVTRFASEPWLALMTTAGILIAYTVVLVVVARRLTRGSAESVSRVARESAARAL